MGQSKTAIDKRKTEPAVFIRTISQRIQTSKGLILLKKIAYEKYLYLDFKNKK